MRPLTHDDRMPMQINTRQPPREGPTNPAVMRDYLGTKEWAPAFAAWMFDEPGRVAGGRIPADWWEHERYVRQVMAVLGARPVQAIVALERYLNSEAAILWDTPRERRIALATIARASGRSGAWLHVQRVRVWQEVERLSKRHRHRTLAQRTA